MARIPILVFTGAVLIVVAQIDVRRGDRSDEASAIASLRAITTAQLAYAAHNGGYAARLMALAARCPGEQRGFVSPDLAGDPTLKSGYVIRIQAGADARQGPGDCNGAPTFSTYYASAVPIEGSGTRAFAVDQGGMIWYDASGIPPRTPFRETGTIKRLR